MKIYLDLVFFINFFFDFLLLLVVKILLKRNVGIKRIILGALLGATSILFLFLPLNQITLFLLKVIISILMILTTFGFQNKNYFFKNMKIKDPEENAVKFYANMFFYYSLYDGAADKAKAKCQFEYMLDKIVEEMKQ